MSGLEPALQNVLVSAGPLRITVRSLLLFALLIALVMVFLVIARKTYRTYLCNRFHRDYRIDLGRAVEIHRRKEKGPNSFNLIFPKWIHRNKDRSRDRRRSSNKIVRGSCVLLVDGYRIVCDSPAHLVWLVNALRVRGVSIDRCPEEERKYQRLMERHGLLRDRETVASLVDRFREKPTDFESYCAGLFGLLGFKAEVTPPSRDGGYDIGLWSGSALEGIVECKCYEPDNKVGRDLVQKLVGANATLGAPRMIFVTTSDFSSDAREYAVNTGVELVNGASLVRMVGGVSEGIGEGAIAVEEWQLRREDLVRYYPPDCPPERFDV